MVKEREKPLSKEEIEGTEQWKQSCLALASVLGVATFRSWFMNVVPVDLGGQSPHLRCGSVFKAQWIRSRFGQTLEGVLKGYYPDMRGIEIVP